MRRDFYMTSQVENNKSGAGFESGARTRGMGVSEVCSI